MEENALYLLFNETIYLADSATITPKATKEDTHQQGSPPLKSVIILSKIALNEDENSFLQKVMQAINLNQTDYSIVIGSEISSLLGELNKKKVISFGVSAIDLQIQELAFPLYEVKKLNESDYLFADSVQKIATDVQKKQALWLNLKRMFSL